MTEEHLDDVFRMFVGRSHYLLTTEDLLQVMELRDSAGQHIVKVIDIERCEIMGATVEPWRPMMPGLDASNFWLWRLDDIERPRWLPDDDSGLSFPGDDEVDRY